MARVSRRVLMPLSVGAVVLVGALCAVMTVVGVAVAPFDRRCRLARVGLFGVAYSGLELVGLLSYLGIWLLRPVRGAAWCAKADLRVLASILDRLYAAGKQLLGFEVHLEVTGVPDLAGPGPLLVFARHGGFGDSFALVWLISTCWGRRPRVLLKRPLMAEPLVDVALTRLDACFLPGGAPDRVRRVGALATSLEPGDALLVFPEGGNWTPHRRARAVWRLWAGRKRRAARHALLMEHVLPPRPAGVLACLDARPELPVIVVAHTGLDLLTTPRCVWRAIPFQAPMTVRWWLAPPPPGSDEARIEWLTAQWAVVDEWIDVRQPVPAAHDVEL